MFKIGIPQYDGSDSAVLIAGGTTPYFDEPMSDHDSTSDITADEGYEADVEILEQTVDDEVYYIALSFYSAFTKLNSARVK